MQSFFHAICRHYVPPPPNLEGGGEYIVFVADPVGVGVSIRFHLRALASDQLMDFDQTCIDTLLGEGEELIRFWWP